MLVTGARGFIGAWVVKALLGAGRRVVAFDPDPNRGRLRQVLEDDGDDLLTEVAGDVTELDQITSTIADNGVAGVIHLAALQVPACAANPSLGARVNVVGTANVLLAARDTGLERPVVFASSVAALAPEGADHPSTIYGVFKRANEGTSALMWRDEGVASIGLRPHTVYGVGRDQGLTSAPTKAMLHAAAGLPFHIGFGGSFQMQFGADVARAFIAALDSGFRGSEVLNFPTRAVDMATVVAAIEGVLPQAASSITFDSAPLPFPAQPETDDMATVIGVIPETPLQAGVESTIHQFQRLLERGLLKSGQ